MYVRNQNKTRPVTVAAFILAGGLSTRMGRDKSRVLIGGESMLDRVKRTVAETGLKARVVRTDAVARCGPLGGIYTALKRTRANTVLILACDMPYVSSSFLSRFARELRTDHQAVFAEEMGRAGFPMLLRRESCLPLIEHQIERREYSLQRLAKLLGAKMTSPTNRRTRDLLNINTSAELDTANAAGIGGKPRNNPRSAANKR